MPAISIIVAMTPEGVIGNQGKLPWNIPSDMKSFARITEGRPLIMGRKTLVSILAKKGGLLAGREHIVLTRHNTRYVRAQGATPARTIEDALALVAFEKAAYVIGGAELYRQFLEAKMVDHLCITTVYPEAPAEGDTHFPRLDLAPWERVIWSCGPRRYHKKDECPTTFAQYNRKQKTPPA